MASRSLVWWPGDSLQTLPAQVVPDSPPNIWPHVADSNGWNGPGETVSLQQTFRGSNEALHRHSNAGRMID